MFEGRFLTRLVVVMTFAILLVFESTLFAAKPLIIKIDRRISDPKHQLGYLWVDGKLGFYTLELPDGNNAPYVSSIPAGEYSAQINNLHNDRGLRWRIELLGVPNRDRVQIHIGNRATFTDTKGCILVGKAITRIGNSGEWQLVDSKSALSELKSAIDNRINDPVDPPTDIKVVIKDVK